MAASSRIADLIARRVPGHSLERDFYTGDDVYASDVERIWREGARLRSERSSPFWDRRWRGARTLLCPVPIP